MSRFVLQRLALVIPTLIGTSLIVFILLRLLPGDIVDILFGGDPQASQQTLDQIRESLGLNKPLIVQYIEWVGGLLRGDAGISMRSGIPVSESVVRSMPVTIQLGLMAILLACIFAVPMGVLSAVRRNGASDLITRVIGLIGLSFPAFWLATMFLLISSTIFRWVPPLKWVAPWEDLGQNMQIMFVPALLLALQPMAIIMRMTRASMLEVLRQDYIRTAYAKGLHDRLVLVRHALQNAFIPVLTVIGVQFGALMGGSVIIEQIFSLPGVAFYLLSGIYNRDYPVVQSTVLFLSLIFILVNLAVDVLYGYIDPRIRHA
ncbi:MAG: ABC transporter permease [Oscillochloris sp.]|nr:ABC transporter permease [Oscillochloris sp.]